MNQQPKYVIDCADHAGFIRLANGQKNVLTRANKSSSLQEDYTQSKSGDILKLLDNQTGASIQVKIVNMKIYSSLEKLFFTSDIPQETFNREFQNVAELKQEYENNRPGYTKIIEQNGLVVWRIELLK